MSLVSFVRAQSAEPELLKKAIVESLELIKFDFGKKAKKIVIKPNMCYYYHPSTGEVTDPRFVGALIDVFREKLGASEILVVESDASAMTCKNAFSMLGYDEMAAEKRVTLVNLCNMKYRVVNKTIRGRDFKFHIPELFSEADLVVNVPKPKYMEVVKISCALKNFYGCNAYQNKFIYHKVLDDAIVAINESVKTHLVVLDGLVVVGKYTKRLNLVMSSEDPVSADSAVSQMMGLAPKSIGAIVLAAKKGIGISSFSPVGEFSYFKSQFPSKTLKDDLRATAANIYLQIFSEH
ncbi:MAG: DUF362 domain-containing protein [Candidatus Bathyarchaeia archaeon]